MRAATVRHTFKTLKKRTSEKERFCKKEGCKDLALSRADACWNHLDEKKDYCADLFAFIEKSKNVKGFNLKKVSLKGFSFHDVNFSETDLSLSDLSDAQLYNSSFRGANLVGANFSRAELTNADFTAAELAKSDLSNARLWNCDFMEANLSESNLREADLWNASFFKVKFWHTNFVASKFLSKSSFLKMKRRRFTFDRPKIDETGLFSAEESYRDIKNYFLFNGMYNDASWASFKEKAMERLILKKRRSLSYFLSLLMNILSGYGERPSRVILSALATIVTYAFIFLAVGAVESSVYIGEDMSLADYIYYSAITFTTVGYGDFLPKPTALFRLLAASEAFIGTFLTGLFIFTLARRYSAR